MNKEPIRDGVIVVPLDAETIERLKMLAAICGDNPISVAASLLHDILEDDFLAHQTVQ